MYYKLEFRRPDELNWKVLYFANMLDVDEFKQGIGREAFVFGELYRLTLDQYNEERGARTTYFHYP